MAGHGQRFVLEEGEAKIVDRMLLVLFAETLFVLLVPVLRLDVRIGFFVVIGSWLGALRYIVGDEWKNSRP